MRRWAAGIVEHLAGPGRTALAPRVHIVVHRPVPAWVVRIAAGATALGCASLVASGRVQWMIAVGLAAGIVVRPRSFAVTGLVVAVALGLVGDAPFGPRLHVLLLATHLLLVLAVGAGDVPWRGTIERSVLTAGTGRFVAIQAVTQATALGAAWVAGQQFSAPRVPVAGALGLAALAWAGVSRLRNQQAAGER